MINENSILDKTLKSYLENSPYTEKEKQEITLWLDGILIAEPKEEELNAIKRFD